MWKCSECGTETIPDELPTCPHCFAPREKPKAKSAPQAPKKKEDHPDG